MTERESNRWLRVIAVFKLLKAALLVAVGLSSIELLRPAIAASAQAWLETLATSIDRRWAHQLIAWISGLRPGRLEVIAIGAFLYAALFIVEGTGLWLAKRWAEYLTVIATMSFVPFEAYELVRRFSAPRVAALMMNLAVVAYLIYRLRLSHKGAAAGYS